MTKKEAVKILRQGKKASQILDMLDKISDVAAPTVVVEEPATESETDFSDLEFAR